MGPLVIVKRSLTDILNGVTRKELVTPQEFDRIRWDFRWKIEKRLGDWDLPGHGLVPWSPKPYEVLEFPGNLLTTNGANALLTAVTGGSITAFNNANSRLGVGDSTTAAAAGQTDLQAATNKLRKGMDATYPSISGNRCDWRATFGDSEANWQWNEWAVFNAASGGTMLNRRVEGSANTKASGTWTLTGYITLS